MNSLKSSDQIIKQQRFTLLELLDRLLDKGVMVKGEILLTVADIDLVYLNVGLLLSSVKSVEKTYRSSRNDDSGRRFVEDVESANCDAGNATSIAWQTSAQEEFMSAAYEADEIRPNTPAQKLPELDDLQPVIRRESAVSFSEETSVDRAEDTGMSAKPVSATTGQGLDQIFQPRANIDPENVEKGLARLVLTLVELLRKLMEKQAVRRIDDKQLNAEEVERMGNAFLLLDKKMEQLKNIFDLKDEDLNLDLGPLGDLM